MRIALATDSLHPRVGGPAYSVGSIGRYLFERQVSVSFLSLGGRRTVPRHLLGSARDLVRADVVHVFGIWTPFSHAMALTSRMLQRPTVLCPLGMLEPWCLEHHALRKRVAMKLYQRHDLMSYQALQATSATEAENLRALDLRVPIALIPHGIDLSESVDPAPPRDDGVRTCLFMSRLHPKKGLMELIEAWAALRPSGWRVIIAGPDQDGYRAKLERAVRGHNLQQAFDFVGHVEGRRKAELLSSADLFVLPTHSENFGLVVPEALAHGLPVLTTVGAPWRELEETGSGWWIRTGTEALTEALRSVLSLPAATLREMGERGRLMVLERYGWQSIISKHIELYAWLCGHTHKPDFVQT